MNTKKTKLGKREEADVQDLRRFIDNECVNFEFKDDKCEDEFFKRGNTIESTADLMRAFKTFLKDKYGNNKKLDHIKIQKFNYYLKYINCFMQNRINGGNYGQRHIMTKKLYERQKGKKTKKTQKCNDKIAIERQTKQHKDIQIEKRYNISIKRYKMIDNANCWNIVYLHNRNEDVAATRAVSLQKYLDQKINKIIDDNMSNFKRAIDDYERISFKKFDPYRKDVNHDYTDDDPDEDLMDINKADREFYTDTDTNMEYPFYKYLVIGPNFSCSTSTHSKHPNDRYVLQLYKNREPDDIEECCDEIYKLLNEAKKDYYKLIDPNYVYKRKLRGIENISDVINKIDYLNIPDSLDEMIEDEMIEDAVIEGDKIIKEDLTESEITSKIVPTEDRDDNIEIHTDEENSISKDLSEDSYDNEDYSFESVEESCEIKAEKLISNDVKHLDATWQCMKKKIDQGPVNIPDLGETCQKNDLNIVRLDMKKFKMPNNGKNVKFVFVEPSSATSFPMKITTKSSFKKIKEKETNEDTFEEVQEPVIIGSHNNAETLHIGKIFYRENNDGNVIVETLDADNIKIKVKNKTHIDERTRKYLMINTGSGKKLIESMGGFALKVDKNAIDDTPEPSFSLFNPICIYFNTKGEPQNWMIIPS